MINYTSFEFGSVDEELMSWTVTTCCANVLKWLSGKQSIKEWLRPDITSRHKSCQTYLQHIICNGDEAGIHMLCMYQTKFFNLCNIFRRRILLEDIEHVLVEEQPAMFLHTLGHNQHTWMIGITYPCFGETVSCFFRLYSVRLDILRMSALDDLLYSLITRLPIAHTIEPTSRLVARFNIIYYHLPIY